MPRFVLLRHECPNDIPKPSHWDFMLERDGVLCTWELRALPLQWSNSEDTAEEAMQVTRLPDHRIDYLEYEGPVSNNRGSVSRVDSGTFEFVRQGDNYWEVRLLGAKVRGSVRLESLGDSWTMTALHC